MSVLVLNHKQYLVRVRKAGWELRRVYSEYLTELLTAAFMFLKNSLMLLFSAVTSLIRPFLPASHAIPQPYQSVLLLAEDHLMVEVHVSKVLGYGEATQAVARVVEISGPEHMTT